MMMIRRNKQYGRKMWNNGWAGRQGVNRAIERRFRQTEAADIADQLDDTDDSPDTLLGRDEILSILAMYDEMVDVHGYLAGQDEDHQAELFDLLPMAV